MAQAIQAVLIGLLASWRQQFGLDVTLKPATGDCILNIASMYPGSEGLATIIMKKPCDASLIQTIQAFDIVLCQVDGTNTHVHMCGKDKEREMHALEVQYIINRRRGSWHEQEFERYQQRREAMGLCRLQPGEKRSHWDEGMRLAYLERFGGTAYQAQRAKDVEEQRADFLKIEIDAREEAATRRAEMKSCILDKPLSSVTVTYLRFTESVFNAVVLTLLHFFLLDCVLEGFTVTDASSGQTWGLSSSTPRALPGLVLLEPSVQCVREGGLPRAVTRLAAQRNVSSSKKDAVRRLLNFGLSDADVEHATRRFYSGKTFLQYVLESPDLCENGAAIAHACRADMDGNLDTARPVFFVLVQVMLNIALEFHRAPLDEPTAHIHDFFSDLWASYTRVAATAVENEKYLCRGMTLVRYTDVLQALMADTLEVDESAFLLKNGVSH